MKSAILIIIATIWAVGCAVDPNMRSTTDTKVSSANVGERISCISPPPEILTAGIEAEITASSEKLEEIASANISASKKLKLFREVFPGVHSFEVMEYRFCRMYANGLIDKDTYNEFVRLLLPTQGDATAVAADSGISSPKPQKKQDTLIRSDNVSYESQGIVFSLESCSVGFNQPGFPRGAIVCSVTVLNTTNSARELIIGRGFGGRSRFIDNNGNQEDAYTIRPGYTATSYQKASVFPQVPQKVIFVAHKKNLTGSHITLIIEVKGLEKPVILRSVPVVR